MFEGAITEGIKIVGVGKKGSKPLSAELIQAILAELKSGDVPDVVRGAFFGALILKGISGDECLLESIFSPNTFTDYARLAQHISPEASENAQALGAALLQGKTLSKEAARQLGDFLFSNQPGDGLRGLAASVLRVRYETPDEFDGLLASLQDTLTLSFRQDVPLGDPVVQIAEPFDGVTRSYLVTPLLARYVQGLGFRAVSLAGRSSGPKYGNNMLNLFEALQEEKALMHENKSLASTAPAFGWYVNQAEMSPAMDRWVDLRQQIIKRPFLATLERFVNPVQARFVIASAFHAPYGEKMRTIAEQAGYPGIIIVRNGLEGTLAFSIKRPVKLLCAARQKDGSYIREELVFRAEEYWTQKCVGEERVDNPLLNDNARLIKTYQTQGQTDCALFDACVQATCAGIEKAVSWIKNNQESRV